MQDVIAELTDAVEEHLGKARRSDHGRSAHLLLHDGVLRQSIIALVAGAALDEHNAPSAATLQVLRGRLRLTWADGGTELAAGQLGAIPKERHGLTALEDSAVLLTTVTSVG